MADKNNSFAQLAARFAESGKENNGKRINEFYEEFGDPTRTMVVDEDGDKYTYGYWGTADGVWRVRQLKDGRYNPYLATFFHNREIDILRSF